MFTAVRAAIWPEQLMSLQMRNRGLEKRGTLTEVTLFNVCRTGLRTWVSLCLPHSFMEGCAHRALINVLSKVMT